MSSKRKNNFFLFIAAAVLLQYAPAQVKKDSVFRLGVPVIVIGKDKKETSGVVSAVKDSSVVLKRGIRDSSELKLSSMQNAFIADEDNFMRGHYIHPDRLYMFNPTFATAFPLPRHTAWIRTTSFGSGAVHMAFSDKGNIGYFSTFLCAPVGFNLRYSLKLGNRLYAAPETGIASASWAAPNVWMWSAGARASQGNSQKNITVGGGYLVLQGLKKNAIPHLKKKYEAAYINFGVKQRLSKKVSLAADLWYIHNPRIILAGLFARVHRSRISQWCFGALYLHINFDGHAINLPVPLIQWNTKF